MERNAKILGWDPLGAAYWVQVGGRFVSAIFEFKPEDISRLKEEDGVCLDDDPKTLLMAAINEEERGKVREWLEENDII